MICRESDGDQFSKDYKGLIKKTKKINDEARNAYLTELQDKEEQEMLHEQAVTAKNKPYKKPRIRVSFFKVHEATKDTAGCV